MPTELPQLLTGREVAELLRIDKRTVTDYAASGRLDVVKLNARVFRYPRESVRRLMEPTQAEDS